MCENDQVEVVEHVPDNEQEADILTKAFAKIKFKEMIILIDVKNVSKNEIKLKGKNVEISLKIA